MLSASGGQHLIVWGPAWTQHVLQQSEEGQSRSPFTSSPPPPLLSSPPLNCSRFCSGTNSAIVTAFIHTNIGTYFIRRNPPCPLFVCATPCLYLPLVLFHTHIFPAPSTSRPPPSPLAPSLLPSPSETLSVPFCQFLFTPFIPPQCITYAISLFLSTFVRLICCSSFIPFGINTERERETDDRRKFALITFK